MASSSIDVMGMAGNEMRVMLVPSQPEDDPHDEEMARKMQEIIHSTGPPGHIINTGPPLEQTPSSADEDFEGLDNFPTIGGMDPPPGTIIFSPQDLVRPGKPPMRGRGRGRGIGPSTIKQEPSNASNSMSLEVPVACEICNKVMMSGKTLVQHMAIHSDMKPFQCPHCPKSFARKVHLQGHLVIHGIEKQFECPVCHQRFSRQDCVKVHMRLHDKSKCVFCDVCHKAFLTVGALNIHLRIHRGEKPFKCHLCSKCFTQKNHLITHIKRHTKVTDDHFTKKLGPRMFKCEHCPRSFIRLSDYERHVQWNHGAVADGSIVDKLPTVNNILEGEMKQTGLAPQIFKAPRDALKKVGRRKPRKVMCTTSTQTDEDGGHIIIPRMYQHGQVSAGTQVSAPPTPRPADDDMYENDIFDEGMDRNYSSDEDEAALNEENMGDHKVYAVTATSDMASDPVQDAAFDAIVQGSVKQTTIEERECKAPVKEVVEQTNENLSIEEQENTSDQHALFLQEVVSSMSKHGLDVIEPEPDQNENQPPEVNTMEISENMKENGIAHLESIEEVTNGDETRQFEEQGQQEMTITEVTEPTEPTDESMQSPAGYYFKSAYSKPVRGRGRPRGRGKRHLYGLTGAAELRAMRKTMMISILNANAEEPKDATDTNEVSELRKINVDEAEIEGRAKRMAKKQHGTDFICSMKSCETCVPPQKQNKMKKVNESEDSSNKRPIVSSPSPKTVVRQVINASQIASPRPVIKTLNTTVERSPKPVIKHINITENQIRPITSFSSSLPNANEVNIPPNHESLYTKNNLPVYNSKEAADPRMKIGNRVGTYPVDITANPIVKKEKREDYFVTTSKADSIISPPVELMSFCIPTYSCKLCGREFRFEGKLHRHIESVHQNKAIFSDDVKPGRGSSKYASGNVELPPIPSELKQIKMDPPPTENINPEIAALRSEWSDDDDDDDDEEDTAAVVRTAAPTITTLPPRHAPITIVTRAITPVTSSLTDAHIYSSGVKVNMNKLAGLLPPNRTTPITTDSGKYGIETRVPDIDATVHRPREPEAITADTLDMKCRRLLEKLFDHDLLLNCGLLEEHVSVVLGRVLQHYGVKMIEDYGQGQYEVLKYNLWRLIEWKVTMEQMEEFYTEGKSVEEMMDDIMNERVPLVSHHFVPNEQKANPPMPPPASSSAAAPVQTSQPQVAQVEAMEVADGQMVLQQVASVLGGQLNSLDGVTQVVLAQDVSPELLQGAHIVTIDPATGQVLSQVTADQVILTDSIGDELEQQVAALDGQVVVSQSHLSNVSQENIVVTQSSGLAVQGQITHGHHVMMQGNTAVQHQLHQPHQENVKIETTVSQHHLHHHQ